MAGDLVDCWCTFGGSLGTDGAFPYTLCGCLSGAAVVWGSCAVAWDLDWGCTISAWISAGFSSFSGALEGEATTSLAPDACFSSSSASL